jgi:DNA invertase Pin-like site-specific DNA recombinase
MNGKFIAYYRVSTARQGRSGLGLDAQRKAVADYLNGGRWRLLAEFTEVESGKQAHNRPKLAEALHLAKVTGATVVIAKLDRLSRNAAFLLTLRDAGVSFVAADMPDANHMVVGVMALIAQHEREAISQRTREALQAAKRRGVVLGNPNGAAALRRARKGNKASVKAIKAAADQHADNLRPVIEQLRQEGVTSLGGIADELNEREMRTPRGGQWYKTSVRNLLTRLG